MILDATAGDRTMYAKKECEHIIYIDIERKLQNKPTIFADNTNTPFLSNTFDTIFYDPPHVWGSKEGYPEELSKDYKHWAMEHKPFAFTYYGWDKYKTRQALVRHIYNAQLEFKRILKDDGLLWLKWNECRIPLYKILSLFSDWAELMRLYVADPTQTAGIHQTYWVVLCKKNMSGTQLQLL